MVWNCSNVMESAKGMKASFHLGKWAMGGPIFHVGMGGQSLMWAIEGKC